MAVGDHSWIRQVWASNVAGASGAVHQIATVAPNMRLERVLLDFHLAVNSGLSSELLVWVQQGVVINVEWTDAAGGVPPTPSIPRAFDLSSKDILASAYSRMGPAETFTDVHMVPAYDDAVRLDTQVRRRPQSGHTASIWVTWALGAIAGTLPAVGYPKFYARALLTQVA